MSKTTEQPTGLQLAVRLLAQIGDEQSDAAIAAVHAVMDPGQQGELPDGLQLADTLLAESEHVSEAVDCARVAIRAEHIKMMTIQRHASSQAQRIADLERHAAYLVAESEAKIPAMQAAFEERLTLDRANRLLVKRIADIETKCVTLKRLHDAAADERDALRVKHDELLTALHGIGKALGIPEGERSPYSVTCGALERVNRLAEIEAQEPVAISKAGNLFWAGNPQDWRGVDCSLYPRPVPAQTAPDADKLAQHIRSIDGRNSLGAGALAERIVEWMAAPEHKA